MSLPYSRNSTHVAGVSQVKAADLNAVQDFLISAFAFMWSENWRINAAASGVDTTTKDGSTDPEGWEFNTLTGGDVTREYMDPDAALRGRSVELEGAVVSDSAELQSENIVYVDDDVEFALEFTLRANTLLGSSGATAAVGVQLGTHVAYVRAVHGTANWSGYVIHSGGTVSNDLGVAVADNSTHRCRIEIKGANRHAGSDTLIDFYLDDDDTPAHSSTYVFGPDVARIYLSLQCGDSASQGFRVGRMLARWLDT